MLTIAVRGKSVVVSDDFETALREYASANYLQGAAKKSEPEESRQAARNERKAYIKLYDAMAKMFEVYHAEVIGEPTELLIGDEKPSQAITVDNRVDNLEYWLRKIEGRVIGLESRE